MNVGGKKCKKGLIGIVDSQMVLSQRKFSLQNNTLNGNENSTGKETEKFPILRISNLRLT